MANEKLKLNKLKVMIKVPIIKRGQHPLQDRRCWTVKCIGGNITYIASNFRLIPKCWCWSLGIY